MTSSAPKRRRKRRALLIVALVFLSLGVLAGRALWEGRVALERGDSAMASGDLEGAVRSWRRAARWYLPMASHVGTAYDKLRKLALSSETHQRPEIALIAWRGIRSSVRATRSFYTPQEQRVSEADLHIARLMAREDVEAGGPMSVGEATSWQLELLQRDDMPSVGWSVFAILGLALWIGGGFVFAFHGIDQKDRLVPRAAAYSGAAVASGLLIWLLGLHWA